MSCSLLANCRSLDSLNCRTRCGRRPCRRQMRCTELALMPFSWAIAAAVQCVVSPGGSASVRATTLCSTAAVNGGMRDGRVLSHSKPSTPSVMNRSCQRPHCRLAGARAAHDLRCAATIRGQQNDVRSPHMFLSGVSICHDRCQSLAVTGTYLDDDPCAHAINSHPRPASGILIRTHPSDFVHSHVRHFKLQARIFLACPPSCSVRPPLGKAGGTIMKRRLIML